MIARSEDVAAVAAREDIRDRGIGRIPFAAISFVLAFILMSPVLTAVGVKGVLLLLGAIFVLLINGKVLITRVHTTVYAFGCLYVLIAVIMSFYWGSHVPLMFAILYVFALAVTANTRARELDLVVRYATVFQAILIVLAWIGLLYFLAGGGPLGGIVNPDGRDNLLYLTTFSNATGDGWMRASAIYDEPGAFSFFICTVCALREIMGKNKNVTALLLVGGLVTLSISHIVYMAFHFASHMLTATNRKSLGVVLVTAFALSLVLLSGRIQSIVQEIIVERAVKYQSGELNNPREEQMLTVYREMTLEKLLLGFGEECAARSPDCTKRMGGDFGENPLTPIVYGGLVLAFPYYLTVLTLAIFGMTSRRRWFLIGFAFLLLQRPYVLEFPYSMTVFLVVLALAARPRAEQGLERA